MGHRGIPVVPVDGTQYSSVGLLGLPLVMEYDETTGGFKLVVSTEAGVTVNISGTVAIQASDIEIGAVEIKDGVTDQRATVHGGGSVYTDVQELGPALPLDSDVNSNVGYSGTIVGAQIVGPSGGGLWRRASMAVDDDFALRSSQFSLITASDLRVYDGTSGSWVRARGNITNGLDVDVTRLPTGTVFGIGGSVDTELPAAIVLSDALANPTVPGVGAYNLAYNATEDDWERMRSEGISGSFAVRVSLYGQIGAAFQPLQLNTDKSLVIVSQYQTTPSGNQAATLSSIPTIAFAHAFNGVDTNWPRTSAGAVNGDAIIAWSETAGRPHYGAALLGLNAGGVWDRLRTSIAQGLQVDVTRLALAKSEYAEDSLHTSGATGTFVLAVRQDSPTAMAAAADYTPFITDQLGRLHVTPGFQTGSVIGGYDFGVVKRAVINISGSGGEQSLVAAAGGSLRIKVVEAMLVSDSAVKVFFQSGFTGTALTGPMSLPADGDGFFLKSPDMLSNYHFETQPNQALVLDMSAIAAVGGWINWIEAN